MVILCKEERYKKKDSRKFLKMLINNCCLWMVSFGIIFICDYFSVSPSSSVLRKCNSFTIPEVA